MYVHELIVKLVHILVHWSKSLNEVLFTIYIFGIGIPTI